MSSKKSGGGSMECCPILGKIFCASVILLALLLVGFVSASNARQSASNYAPTLLVSAKRGALTIDFSQLPSGDPTAKLVFYTPLGAAPTLTAAPGTTIGTVAARATAVDLGNAALELAGTIVVRSATDSYLSGGAAVPIATASTACTGTDVHSTFWVLVLSTAEQTLELPMFVDVVPPDAPAAAFATATVQACLPSPDVPQGTPGRATFGVKVVDAILNIGNVFSLTAGEQRWRMTATPYMPGIGTPSPTGTIEAQSLLRQPPAVRFIAKGIKGKARARVSGIVTEGGKPVAGAIVQIICEAVLATVRTDQSGLFHATVSVGTPADVLFARATVKQRNLGSAACVPTFSTQGLPCISATVAGFTSASRKVTVRT